MGGPGAPGGPEQARRKSFRPPKTGATRAKAKRKRKQQRKSRKGR